MAIANLTEIGVFQAAKQAKREDLRLATRELRYALSLMVELMGRCLEAPVEFDPSPELEREFETASEHLLSLGLCISGIAETLKVSLT